MQLAGPLGHLNHLSLAKGNQEILNKRKCNAVLAKPSIKLIVMDPTGPMEQSSIPLFLQINGLLHNSEKAVFSSTLLVILGYTSVYSFNETGMEMEHGIHSPLVIRANRCFAMRTFWEAFSNIRCRRNVFQRTGCR